MALTEDFNELITKNLPKLIDSIEPSVRFWAELMSAGVLTDETKENITYNVPKRKQIDAFLSYLRMRPKEDFETFCTALVKTNQKHIVEMYLTPKGKTLAAGAAVGVQDSADYDQKRGAGASNFANASFQGATIHGNVIMASNMGDVVANGKGAK